MRRIWILALALLALGCSVSLEDSSGASEAESCEPPIAVATEELSSINCSESQDTGYTKGTPFPITVVTVDGKKVEKDTANAYYVMAQAAAAAGVNLQVVSGFRTMSEQQYLYNCYKTCSCNNCNLAATPGYSNHQSGHALDLNTSAPGVYNWLNAHAAAYGFKRTVPSEAWHWEWWGGGPGGGPCSCKPHHCEGSKIVDSCGGKGDCAAYGASCVSDSKGVRCVSVFCPALGSKKVCVNDKLIGTCKDGAIETGDCSVYGAKCVDDNLGARCVSVFCPAQGKSKSCFDDHVILDCDNGGIAGQGDCGVYGAYCSTAGVSEATCVSVFCVSDPKEVPKAHDVCLPDGRKAHCTDAGGLVDAVECAGGACVEGGAGAHCPGEGGGGEGGSGTGTGGASASGGQATGSGGWSSGGTVEPEGDDTDVEPPDAGDELEGSCACSAPGQRPRSGWGASVLVLAWALLRRRPRRAV